jgi:hypothetical protein
MVRPVCLRIAVWSNKGGGGGGARGMCSSMRASVDAGGQSGAAGQGQAYQAIEMYYGGAS